MHVLYYTDARSWAGAERVLEVLVATLPQDISVSLVGVDEAVCTRLFQAAGSRATAVTVLSPARFYGDPALIFRIWKTIRKLRPDVVHVNMTWPFSSVEALLAVAVVGDACVVAHEHMPMRMRSRAHALIKRMLSRRVDKHVVVEETVASLLAAEAGLARSALRVIRNGVVLAAGVSAGAARVDPRPTVLGIGRFTWQKGFDVLIDAVAGLPDVCLLLVGARTDDEVAKVREHAAAAGMADRLHVRSWSSDPQSWLMSVDLLAISSRFEAGPLTLLEALVEELPVVCTAVGYAPELLGRLDERLVVPIDDAGRLRSAIDLVLRQPDDSRAVTRKGRAVVESEFSAEAMTRKFVSLYREDVR